MKLRNKKTGDIWEFETISMKIADTTLEELKARGLSGSCFANSIAELNEDWEDYKPAEPLIKGEKIRKAVRAWAIITFDWGKWTENTVRVGYEGDDIYCFKIYDCLFEIPLPEKETIADGEYTIAELCGEEKE